MPAAIDLTGERFGRLVVVREARRDHRNRRTWLCECSCGGEIVSINSKLRSGHVSSCGCLRTENAKRVGRGNTVHGLTNSPTYRSWQSMWTRCTWEKHEAYHRYGGRGISVCKEWETFEGFLSEMGERPEGKTLDRIDNDKGYYKENCRWATRSEQQFNRRGYGNKTG